MTKTFWNDIKAALNSGAEIIADKSEEYLAFTMIKKEIFKLKNQQRKLFIELGEKTYKTLSKKKDANVASNLKIRELNKKIKHVQSELKKQENELKKLKKESSQKKKKSSPASEKKTSSSKTKTSPKIKKSPPKSSKTTKGKGS
ncbi:MAG: hypothetical protein R6V04_01640 [bacterium]